MDRRDFLKLSLGSFLSLIAHLEELFVKTILSEETKEEALSCAKLTSLEERRRHLELPIF